MYVCNIEMEIWKNDMVRLQMLAFFLNILKVLFLEFTARPQNASV